MISYLNVKQYSGDLEVLEDSELEALASSETEVEVIEKYDKYLVLKIQYDDYEEVLDIAAALCRLLMLSDFFEFSIDYQGPENQLDEDAVDEFLNLPA
jgi:hypothetical protein